MKKAASILGMISSVISFLLGIYCYDGFYGGDCVDFKTYGGDAYTDIQNATASAANNISVLSYTIQDMFSFLLIIIGLLAFSYFLLQLANTSKPKKKSVTPSAVTLSNASSDNGPRYYGSGPGDSNAESTNASTDGDTAPTP